MKPLLKVMLILGLIFASTFILGRIFGLLTIENVRFWLTEAQTINPLWVLAIVISLLFSDLFVAVPTLTITILAGFFLGFPLGAAAAFAGMSMAALCGYALSRKWGDKGVKFLVKDAPARDEMIAAFQQSGPAMIMLSRAAPIVPEVTACMAGVTKMPIGRYLLFFSLSTLPYVAVAAYAGSISSIESPQPAIYAALFLYAVLWVGWYLFQRARKKAISAGDYGASRTCC
ncbi:MAG: VTT domain-containing protein [Parasphingorhabdus sp.]|uniref:TVP38/TMEM64 family protein n=1 Tax=Parasphingorhabdus sp. TaxID=2709688 RepID=UPI003297FC6C